MKTSARFALIFALGLCVSANLLAQKPSDMVGTWVGDATLEGMSEPNEFTLVLELKEGELSGHLTDQYGSMSEAPISEVKLEDGVFSFSVVAIGPNSQELKLILKMMGGNKAIIYFLEPTISIVRSKLKVLMS